MAQGPGYSLSLVLLALLLGFASAAAAQGAAASGRRAAALHWVRLPGAEDCSGGDALSRAVEAKLRREVFPAPRNASVLVEGYVERAAGGYRAALQMRATDGALLGSRELSSKASDCDELSETIAVVLAVMIDPESASQGNASGPPEPTAHTTRAGTRLPQGIVGFARVALGVYEVNGSNGEALWGGGLAYEVTLRKWGGLRVEAAGFRELDQIIGPMPTPTALIKLAYAGLGYCPLWLTTGRLRSSACASGEVGGFRASEGSNRLEPPPPAVWVAASLQARLALRLFGPVEAEIGGSVSVTFPRPKFEKSGTYTITLNDICGSVDMGLGVRF